MWHQLLIRELYITDTMQGKILFQERQTFKRSPIIWVSMISATAMLAWITIGAYRQILLGDPMGDNYMSDTSLITLVSSVFILLVAIYVFIFSHLLEVKVDNGGIYYRFVPYFSRQRYIRWEELEKYWVRKYQPIAEYGGWGLRVTFKKSGKAYNIQGDKGLQLVFKNGKRLLLGTQRAIELDKVLSKIKNEVE